MALNSTTFGISLRGDFKLAYGPSGVSIPVYLGTSKTLQSGTSANQADQEYVANRSVTSGSPESIDVRGGSGMYQPDGTAFSVAEIVSIHVVNRSATATLTVGGGTNAVPNIGFTVLPMGEATIYAPLDPAYPVTAGSGDIVKVAADTGTASYDIHIVGRSA